MLSFENVAATGHNTSLSAPLMLTRAETNNWTLHLKEKSFISAFREAGYKTYWISNSAAKGTFSVDVHANDSEEVIYLRKNNNRHGNFDFEIKEKLKSILQTDKSQKIFCVLHSIGSHWRYDNSYPIQFNKFYPLTTDIYTSQFNTVHTEAINNGYDNSILYADYFIGNTIKLLKEKNVSSFVFYVSDHGEHLYNDNKGLVGHIQPTEETIHVPLFIWTSALYDNCLPNKRKTLENHLKSKLSIINVFHTIIDMAQLSYPEENLSKSFASPNFIEMERFILINNFDVPINLNKIY